MAILLYSAKFKECNFRMNNKCNNSHKLNNSSTKPFQHKQIQNLTQLMVMSSKSKSSTGTVSVSVIQLNLNLILEMVLSKISKYQKLLNSNLSNHVLKSLINSLILTWVFMILKKWVKTLLSLHPS